MDKGGEGFIKTGKKERIRLQKLEMEGKAERMA